MLVSLAAFNALKTALTGVANLPAAPAVNDKRLVEFTASNTAKIAHKLVLFSNAPEVQQTLLGDAPQWELSVPVTIVYMVEGEAGDDRDGVWQAGLEALAATLFPAGEGLVVPGVIEDLRWDGSEIDHILDGGEATPVEVLEFTVAAIVTATTPFG